MIMKEINLYFYQIISCSSSSSVFRRPPSLRIETSLDHQLGFNRSFPAVTETERPPVRIVTAYYYRYSFFINSFSSFSRWFLCFPCFQCDAWRYFVLFIRFEFWVFLFQWNGWRFFFSLIRNRSLISLSFLFRYFFF